MKKILLALLMFPALVFAHTPVLSEFANYDDFKEIDDVITSQAFYGELSGFPHTYTFNIPAEQELSIEIMVPDIKETEDKINGLLLRFNEKKRVEEVARLNYRDASWESFYEVFGGDSYRSGPTFKGVVKPGKYLLEVNSPTNHGKYVLVIGEEENIEATGIFSTLGKIYQVKRFYGKPPIAVLQSPFYAVPFAVIVLIGIFVWYRRRKKHA